jgi:hypothetical protein
LKICKKLKFRKKMFYFNLNAKFKNENLKIRM